MFVCMFHCAVPFYLTRWRISQFSEEKNSGGKGLKIANRAFLTFYCQSTSGILDQIFLNLFLSFSGDMCSNECALKL